MINPLALHIRHKIVIASACAGLALVSCSGSKANANAGPSCGVQVDRFKELMIVDDAVVGDARSSNASDGIWSFRRRMEEMTASGGDPAGTAWGWFQTWTSPKTINQYPVAARMLVTSKLLCPWLQLTPANACDATCAVCAAQKLDLAQAPFRLIAIVNRRDLRNPQADPTSAGEARFIYGLTDGPGDSATSPGMNMTVIFEYGQPLQGRSFLQVDQAWHALGSHTAFDESYRVDLEKLMTSFTAPGISPSQPLGNPINQIRTNEKEFDWAWDIRQYELTTTGIVLSSTQNTPDLSWNGTQKLADFLNANRAQIMSNADPNGLAIKVTSPDMQGGAIGVLAPWNAAGVDSTLMQAFALQTCNGCHQNKNIDANFQISPHSSGIAKVSPFLNDPSNPKNDELTRRATLLSNAICEGP